jgi:hypothetical protein
MLLLQRLELRQLFEHSIRWPRALRGCSENMCPMIFRGWSQKPRPLVAASAIGGGNFELSRPEACLLVEGTGE